MNRYVDLSPLELIATLVVGITNITFVYMAVGALLFLAFRRALCIYENAASEAVAHRLLGARRFWVVEHVLLGWFPIHYSWRIMMQGRREAVEEEEG